MQKIVHIIIVIGVGILSGFSCNRPTCHWDAPPYAPIVFQLYKNGQLVTDSSLLASLKVFFIQKNQRVYIDVNGITNAHQNEADATIYENRVMILNGYSTVSYSKNYFLEYTASPQLPIDTLYVDYLSPSPATDCSYKLNSVKFNGVVPRDTTIASIGHVYTFGK